MMDHKEQVSVKFKSKYDNFIQEKHVWKYRLQNGTHFLNMLITAKYTGKPRKNPHSSYGSRLSHNAYFSI